MQHKYYRYIQVYTGIVILTRFYLDVDTNERMCSDTSSIPGFIGRTRGRVVTRWPGSQEVGGSIPGCATKFVRCKNLAFNIGECLPWLGYHVKLLVPCIGRFIPEHVKDPRAPVDKSRVLIPGVTGQIPELLRIAVKLHRHHYR